MDRGFVSHELGFRETGSKVYLQFVAAGAD